MKHQIFGICAAAFLTVSCVSGPANGAGTTSENAQFARAESMRTGDGGVRDPVTAFAMMTTLAQAGHGRAQDTLAYYFWRGISVVADPDQAAFWYLRAIENGRETSRIPYSKLLLEMEMRASALEQLLIAVGLDLNGAKAELAANHVDKKYGARSHPQQGKSDLSDLARDGDVYAMRLVLIKMSQGHEFPLDQVALLDSALAISRDPDNRMRAKIAEALLPYLRMSVGRKALDIRQELLAVPGLRQKVWLAEALYLTADLQPRSFWTDAERIVDQADRDTYARVLFLTSRLSKNAYVRLLQKALKQRGYYTGRATGYLTKQTLQSFARYCRDHNLLETCRLGPLRSQVIKDMSKSLAQSG